MSPPSGSLPPRDRNRDEEQDEVVDEVMDDAGLRGAAADDDDEDELIDDDEDEYDDRTMAADANTTLGLGDATMGDATRAELVDDEDVDALASPGASLLVEERNKDDLNPGCGQIYSNLTDDRM